MGNYTFEQAVRDASESERAAARYFDALAAREFKPTVDDRCRAFAVRARRNADHLAALDRRLAGDLARHADVQIPPMPSVPSFAPCIGASVSEALSIACYSAYRLAFFYDVLVDAAPTHVPLFRELAYWQEELAKEADQLLRATQTRLEAARTAATNSAAAAHPAGT
jgi:nucleotide-binding universal stress UspA family protein